MLAGCGSLASQSEPTETDVAANSSARPTPESDVANPAVDRQAATTGAIAERVELPTETAGQGNVTVSSEFAGSVYLDRRFTGLAAPAVLNLEPGDYLISLGVEEGTPGYYRREVTVTADVPIEVAFVETDKVEAKTWNAVWFGVPRVVVDGECQTDLSPDRLKVWKEDFVKVVDVMEAKSFGTLDWNVEFKVFDEPAEAFDTNGEGGEAEYRVDYEQNLRPLLDSRKDLDEVDSIFIFWAAATDSCSLQANFGGLAYPNAFFEDCYCIRKGNPGVVEVVNYLDENAVPGAEQGVWLHEWLHTTTEDFSAYADMSYEMPLDGPPEFDNFVVHSFDAFGYDDSTEIQFYFDLVQGKVSALGEDQRFLGLGPEALWSEQHRTYDPPDSSMTEDEKTSWRPESSPIWSKQNSVVEPTQHRPPGSPSLRQGVET